MIDFQAAASDGGRFVLKNGYRVRIFGSLKASEPSSLERGSVFCLVV